jgi:hypothetical protein
MINSWQNSWLNSLINSLKTAILGAPSQRNARNDMQTQTNEHGTAILVSDQVTVWNPVDGPARVLCKNVGTDGAALSDNILEAMEIVDRLNSGPLDDMPSLDDCFGCDPWDEDNHGTHPASKGGR